MEMTEALKSYVENRLEKLQSHYDRVTNADIVLSVEKHRHIAEMTLHANGSRIHGKESSTDMYASVDAVLDKIDKQIRKFKERISRYQPRKTKEEREYQHHIIEVVDDVDEGASGAEQGHRIVLREKLSMKPMSVEDAALQLELVEDSFLVFLNAETQQVNVLYSRDDGTYGLIEPKF